MLDPGTYTGTYKVIGGELCLDFANTVSWRGTERAHDWLYNFAHFGAWGELVGQITEQEQADLMNVAEQQHNQAQRVLQKAVVLREAINTIFSDLRYGKPLPQPELAILNAYLPEALGHLQVGVHDNEVLWVWSQDGIELERILWPVLWSAANLLMSERIVKLRTCEACAWLYLDTTKNHSRRWCTMEDCGNRAKVRRFRQRAQSS
ncbi:MAG: ABATE domain-containing protein [Chloroflexota bacterium]